VSALEALLASLPPWTLVVGKGGVGKTTCAAALGLTSGRAGVPTLLLGTDPAATLGAAIGTSLGDAPVPVPGGGALHARQLDPNAARTRFLAQWRDVLITILDRGTYLDTTDAAELVDAAFPGLDEAMAVLTLADLADDRRWTRVVVDTAPTGHTLRLLALPRTFQSLVALLDLMQGKHRVLVSTLLRRYRADDADRFIAEMRARVDGLAAVLRDPARTAAVLVTRPEPAVAAESGRYAAALGELGIRIGAVVVNVAGDDADLAAVDLASEPSGPWPRYIVPRLAAPPMGVDAIVGWAGRVEAAASAAVHRPTARRHVAAPAPVDLAAVVSRRSTLAALTAPLLIVGGKGGVGKTTVACALAGEIARAAPESRTLLVSTDPAPSIGDVLGLDVGDAEASVPGAPGLAARQMDATAAFARFRDQYRATIDQVFDGFLGSSIDVTHDRAIVHELLALAPPGIDEMYALSSLGETLDDGRYAAIVVDPAPTGHLLRLLEMPALALAWAHQVMRLMLKYREVVHLDRAAEELLAFARRTRRVRDMLGDATRAALVVVALDEPLVRGETARLAGAVAALGVHVSGVVWNRAPAAAADPLPLDVPLAQFVASEWTPPPRGMDALRRWLESWRSLRRDD
jgi:arsenite/tail-anchored protein-transporting ATPase